ncbi:MAG: glycosyltransferase family 4 protein [Bacteroidales bacterium]|nr:glycosyltransferase family 4 protein [Bacteroidales bacterium]
MRIGVNTRLMLSGKMDGIGWFATETLKRLVRNHPEHDFYFFFDRKYDPCFVFESNVHPVVLCPPARHPVLWYLFFQISIKRAIKRYNIDLFLSPDGYLPLGTDVPTLTVMHDINFEHSKDFLKPSHQRYMTYFFPQFARYSTRIATVSEFSKHDISTVYNIEPEKIDVVYDGAHEDYKALSAATQQSTRDKYTVGRRYFIFISTILKRKNLATLLTAFDHFKEQDAEEMKLVVVGHRVWWQDELKRAFDAMRHKDDVLFIGRAEPEELALLLGSATALVYPSLFEGFGIPILEAFHAEVPVVTSNTTSMPEVAGDAALLVEPTNVDQLTDALQRVAKDAGLCAELVARGRKRRELFSWDITASRLWDSMMSTFEESK